MSVSGQLFDSTDVPGSGERLADGAALFKKRLIDHSEAIIESVRQISRTSPFRHLTTPGGYRMSVSMTSCGKLGWMSDRSGYRYTRQDPQTGRPWPRMP